MKRFLLAIAISAAALTPAFAADVGVSITIGHPDFFGRIELGNVAPPPVIYARPVIIERGRHVEEEMEPIYLRVPPGHAKNWQRYCARYDACGRPVYFVKDDWYRNQYAPRYREEHRDNRAKERREEYRKDERREERRDDRRDEQHDQEHGNRNDHRNDHRDDRKDDHRDDRDHSEHDRG